MATEAELKKIGTKVIEDDAFRYAFQADPAKALATTVRNSSIGECFSRVILRNRSMCVIGLCVLSLLLTALSPSYAERLGDGGGMSGFFVKVKNQTPVVLNFQARIDNNQEVNIGDPLVRTGAIPAGREQDVFFSGPAVTVAKRNNIPVHCHFIITGDRVPANTVLVVNPLSVHDLLLTPQSLNMAAAPSSTGTGLIAPVPGKPGTITIVVTNNTGQTLSYDATLFRATPYLILAPIVRGSFPSGKSIVEFKCPNIADTSTGAKYTINVSAPNGKRGAFNLSLDRDGKLLSIAAAQLQ
jgi:hypothetical protein